MKKLCVIGFSLMIINSINAQINKGSVFLGGDFGGSSNNTKKDGVSISHQKGLIISPVYGKAVKDNFVIGVSLLFEFTDEKFPATTIDPVNAQKQTFYGANFFIRKYKPIGNSSFYVFVEGGLSVEYNEFKKENTSTLGKENFKTYIGTLYAYPGISYQVSHKLHLETGFVNLLFARYMHEKDIIESANTNPTTYSTNSFAVGASLNNIAPFYVGFRLLINK